MNKHKTHHYVDESGIYIGGFGDGATPPDGAIKVFRGPKNGNDTWDGIKWNDYIPTPLPAPDRDAAIRAIITALSASGMDMTDAQAAMDKME